MTYTRKATLKDALEVVQNIRWEDRREIEGLGHHVTGVPFSVSLSSDAVAFFSDRDVICGVAGVIPDPEKEGTGVVWMICTPELTRHPIAFVRGAKKWLAEVGQKYTMLWNLADARNTFHHKLLKMLGFRAMRKLNVGPYFLPYLEIVKLCASPS